jgi:hypothetical protein
MSLGDGPAARIPMQKTLEYRLFRANLDFPGLFVTAALLTQKK